MKPSEVSLGADPEIFLERGDGTLLPAFSFLPSKYEPLHTPEQGCNYYWDGFQAEYNIAASTDLTECLQSIRYGLKALLKSAKDHDPTARLSLKTVFDTPLEMLRELNAASPEFVEFGCMPSYNAYGIEGIALDGVNCPHRFAGGHIHFGISEYESAMDKIPEIVRALDAVLGVACVSLFANFDNPVRRKYYGLVGEHRLPPHGLEYRSLSDAWLFNPKLASMVLDLARRVLVTTVNGKNRWEASQDEVVECVLRSDVDIARRILKRNTDNGAMNNLGLKTSINLLAPVEQSVPMSSIEDNWNL